MRSFQQLLIGLGRQPKAALAAGRCAAAALSVAAAISALPTTARGEDQDHIFVSTGSGIGEFTTSGETVNASLITGLAHAPTAIAVSGSALFVVSNDGPPNFTERIGEYTTSGETVNASLITGLVWCGGIAVSGTDLFCYNVYGTIGKYSTSGETVNASLITGLDQVPCGYGARCPSPWTFIAVSGSNLFVAGVNAGTIGEYTTSGETVNASLITVPCCVVGIAVSGSNLFVWEDVAGTGTIGEYTTSGETVNASLITGLPCCVLGIAVSGSNLFVGSTDGTIGEYTTSGETVNASLITGLNGAQVFAVGGGPVACGLGFELAPILPLLLWFRGRRMRKQA